MEEDLKVAKEKAEASNLAKSQFLAVINHELRTPLTSIIGLINFLKEPNLPAEEETKIIEAIENCTQHLLNLVTDVLDFSRLKTGKYNLRINNTNIKRVIAEVYDIVRVLANKKKLKLYTKISPDIPPTILTDVRILRQILINLVGNAIKFTDKGSISIHVNLLQKQKNKVRIQILVIDTGHGIPANKLNLIFKPFQQLEDAYTRQSSRSGTGLGLTIVEKLAEMINLKIQVTSTVGKGSTFSLIGEFEIRHENTPSLPIQPAYIKEKIRHKAPQLITNQSLPRQPYVLLVEDDPIIQYVHKKMLLDLGCQIDAVSSGAEAIRQLGKHDIVFVDINLPDISGFKLIQSIREHQTTQHIPIVALTVYTGKEEKQACLDAGANVFASKPISATRLHRLLLEYIK